MIVEAARLETTANNLENNHQQQQSISASSSSCSLPNRVFIGDVEWEDHLKSTQHKKNLKFVPGAAQLMQTLEQ